MYHLNFKTMKSRILYFFMIAIGISACSQKKSLDIDGTWKVVQRQSINGDKVVTTFPGKDEVDVFKTPSFPST